MALHLDSSLTAQQPPQPSLVWHSCPGLAARGETSILVRETRLEDRLSIYIPKGKTKHRPVERLMKLSEKLERSVNYLVVEAILQHLDRYEKQYMGFSSAVAADAAAD